jgi:glucose-1-phosphate cytidylyltransferase
LRRAIFEFIEQDNCVSECERRGTVREWVEPDNRKNSGIVPVIPVYATRTVPGSACWAGRGGAPTKGGSATVALTRSSRSRYERIKAFCFQELHRRKSETGDLALKVAIFAGGLGSRLIEETRVRPKPLVEIANRPILWHIMQHYSTYGHHDFVLALGHMGDAIKKYISDLCQYGGNLRVDFSKRELLGQPEADNVDQIPEPPWVIDLIDTGAETMTGGRLARLQPYLDHETFMLTYGDGVSNVDLDALLAFHRSHGRLATMTMVRPLTTFGHLVVRDDGLVEGFEEKPRTALDWINGGFFVLEPGVFDAVADVTGDDTMWEEGPLPKLMRMGELMAYRHSGFWYCMDHLADKRRLEEMWNNGNRPWATWERQASSSDWASGLRGDGRSAGIGRGGHPGDWVRYRAL